MSDHKDIINDLNLDGLGTLDIAHVKLTDAELQAGIDEALHSRSKVMMFAFSSTWHAHLDATIGIQSSKIKEAQFRLLEYIYGTSSKKELMVALYHQKPCDPEIGRKIVAYAKLKNCVCDLPDSLRECVT